MRIVLGRLFPLYLRFGLKIGLACAAAYAFSYLLGSPYPVWAIVSVIIAMQGNVADSIQAGVARILGTVVGAAVGVGLLLILPRDAASMGAAVVLIATFCGFLTPLTNKAPTVSIAAIVVLVSGVQHVTAGYDEAVKFGLLRVGEICIGVGCAFVVSLLLWPVRLVDTLRADLSLQFSESARLVDTMLSSFLAGQQALPYSLLEGIEKHTWENHERLDKTRKHESMLYHYEHGVMRIQVTALDRTCESLRTMLEALNDYEDEGHDIRTGPEMRILGDAIMATLRHLGGENASAPVPDLVRGLTNGVGGMEARLREVRGAGELRKMELHKILQFFAFYQGMRLLSESLLIALDRLQRYHKPLIAP